MWLFSFIKCNILYSVFKRCLYGPLFFFMVITPATLHFPVPRPHLLFEAQLVAGKTCQFGPINTPEQPEPLSEVSGVLYGKQKHNAELKYPQRIRRLNIFPASKTEVPYDSYCRCLYLIDQHFHSLISIYPVRFCFGSGVGNQFTPLPLSTNRNTLFWDAYITVMIFLSIIKMTFRRELNVSLQHLTPALHQYLTLHLTFSIKSVLDMGEKRGRKLYEFLFNLPVFHVSYASRGFPIIT